MTDTVNVDLTAVIGWLENGCAVEHAITELKIYQARLAAAPKAEPVNDVMNDFACDSAYLAGMATGWNFGQDNDAEGYNNLKTHRTNQMVEARQDLRSQPEAPKAEQEPSHFGHVITYHYGQKPEFVPSGETVSVSDSCTVTPVYTHPWSPTPASDELLEAKATVLDSLLSAEIDGRTAKARLIEYRSGVLAIAQHKGPQS